jgi:hypothetical protein
MPIGVVTIDATVVTNDAVRRNKISILRMQPGLQSTAGITTSSVATEWRGKVLRRGDFQGNRRQAA